MGSVAPQFADNLRVMEKLGRFDLGSREGKAPGGYNCSMAVSHYPFIFMNAAGSQRDVETFVHEAGHAMHSFCMKEAAIPLHIFRDYPIEIAEVASMSMELLTMEYRGNFYPDAVDLLQAQQKNLLGAMETLAWIAVIDSFQYWMYTNPTHTSEERDAHFAALMGEYQPWIDYTDMQHILKKRWHAQLHIFEIPFYYIEYGIAQLGAFGVWKQYKENKEQALKNYRAALSL
jgi:oligoendopeptidase F